MRFVWDKVSDTYIKGMPKLFKKGIASGILWAMVFAEEKSKSIFIQGINDVRPPPLPPPGPLVSRSGKLRDSIRAGVGKNRGWLETNVSYGIIHEVLGVNEFGDKIGKRPFLEPAFEGANMEEIKKIITEEIVRGM